MMFDLNAIMSTDVITAPISASLAEARSLMKENRFHHLPLVNDDRAIGMPFPLGLGVVSNRLPSWIQCVGGSTVVRISR